VTPQTQRRIANFRANRRGYVSFIAFCVLFGISLFAEFIANDRPLLVKFDGDFLMPVFKEYPETRFGGDFPTEADYQDEFVVELIEEKGWIVWAPIPYSYKTVVHGRPAPAPPSRENWLGTDDQSRDVAARLIYGYRISVLFGLVLTAVSMVVGVSAGVTQGFFGGWVDLGFQRFMEIWAAIPRLYLLIILASVVQPDFWWLLAILLLFSWMGYVGVVRAEVLRARNLDFVRAARALGVSNIVIMFRHVMPNALVATITFLPFNLSGAVTLLAGLTFLGFGLPPGSASLGEMVTQGRNNLHAPWLGLTSFVALGTMLVLLIFTGEAIRDAFDPRVTHAAPPPEETT
jgi:microcin C transport system permease protein